MTWNWRTATLWQQLLVTLLIIACASAIRMEFFSGLGRGIPYLTYYPAVMLAALYGGLPAGILATVLSAGLCFFWIQQGFMSPIESLAIVVFVISCVMISFICEALRRTYQRAQLAQAQTEAVNQLLQHEVAEHQRTEAALVTLHRQYETILVSAGEGILGLDLLGHHTFANPSAEKILGYGIKELLGQSSHTLWHHTRSDGQQFPEADCPIYASFTNGIINSCASDSFWRKDGTRVSVNYTSTPLRDAQGVLQGAVVVFRDITERVRTEEAIRAKNEELEQFVYTVSHDLRSPVVTLQTFLGHLEQDIPANNARRMATDFEYLHAAANKMAQLLDELLKLSRIGHATNPSVDVLLQDVVMEALELVAGRMAPLGVQVTVTADPIILCGDRARFVGLFQNLLDNACKFMGDQPAPRIEIGVETREAKTVFFVRDNGDGIDPRHQVKVFGLFEKLDPHADGTGMGRIIFHQ